VATRNNVVTPSARVLANKANGRRGGLATAHKHGPEFCQARAAKAGQTVKAKYGRDFYSYIRRKVTKKVGWPKGKPRKPLAQSETTQILTTDAVIVAGNLTNQIQPRSTSV